MALAAHDWLLRWPWRNEPGAYLMPEPDLREYLRRAYTEGYQDGRKSKEQAPAQARPRP